MGSSWFCILPWFRYRQADGSRFEPITSENCPGGGRGGDNDDDGYAGGGYDGYGYDGDIWADQYEVNPGLTGEPSIVKIFPPQKSPPKSHINRQILPAE